MKKYFQKIVFFLIVLILCFLELPSSIQKSFAADSLTIREAVNRTAVATVSATNDTIQVIGFFDTGSDTGTVILSGDIEIATITAHCAPIRVHVYNGTIVSDSAFIWPGTAKPLPVANRDSLRIIRNKGVTRVDWELFMSKTNSSAPSYMRRFTKTCPITHGDTLAIGGTVTYTQDQANMVVDGVPLHPGTCVYFESLHILAVGQDLIQKLGYVHVKMWLGDHQVFNGVVPANVWVPIDFCRFDSFTITDLDIGTLDFITWTPSWNNRL